MERRTPIMIALAIKNTLNTSSVNFHVKAMNVPRAMLTMKTLVILMTILFMFCPACSGLGSLLDTSNGPSDTSGTDTIEKQDAAPVEDENNTFIRDMGTNADEDVLGDTGEHQDTFIGKDTSTGTDESQQNGQTHEGTIENDFKATVTGKGTQRVGTINFTNDVGEIVIHGKTMPAFFYQYHDWVEFGYLLVDIIAVEEDNLHVVYLYCVDSDLQLLYHESFTDEMASEYTTGTCSFQMGSSSRTVTINDLEANPVPPPSVKSFTVSGADIAISNGSGNADILDVGPMNVTVFNLVDCSTICSADPQDGWWELHSMLISASPAKQCFGIFYLYVRGDIAFSYGFCINDFTRLSDYYIDATWSK